MNAAVWLVVGSERGLDLAAVAEGLIGALRIRGLPAVGVKPIDVGCPYAEDHDLRSADGERLWAASDRALPPLVAAPYRFRASGDPVAAAAAAGLELTIRDVLSTVEDAARFGGPVVVLGPDHADQPYAADGDVWDLGRALTAKIVAVAATAPELSPLSARAAAEGLELVKVLLGAEPADGAVLGAPDADGPAALATQLSAALNGAT